MFSKKGVFSVSLFCMMAGLFCLPMAVNAAKSPPSIDDIVGTYAVKTATVWLDFAYAEISKNAQLQTWHIVKTSSVTVHVDIDEWSWGFTGRYENGMLVFANGDTLNEPPLQLNTGIFLCSGTYSKIKFKGEAGFNDLSSSSECLYGKYAGTMTSVNPGITALTRQPASQSSAEAAPLSKSAPPGIDDILGTYLAKMKGKLYHPSTGTSESGSQVETLTLTKTGAYTLNVHFNALGWTLPAYYQNGFLMIGDIDNAVLDTDGYLSILTVQGSAGKLTIKGKTFSLMNLGSVDDEYEVGTVSAKQIPEPI